MSPVRINHHPSRKQLLLFGLLWAIVWTFFAAAAWCRGGSPAVVCAFAALAAAVPLGGLVVPGLLRWTCVGFAYATYPIGLAMSLVILLAVFYLVFTPVGIVMRLLGHDPMGRRFTSAGSYWTKRKPDEPAASYFRPY